MLTAKQLLKELQKERNDTKGRKITIEVDGNEYEALGFQVNVTENKIRIIAETKDHK